MSAPTKIVCSLLFLSQPVIAQDHEQVHAVESADNIIYMAAEENGNAQSPINIITSNTVPGQHQVALHYLPSGQHIGNLGHTVEVFYDQGSSLDFDGDNFLLQQIHFHTPSEHLIDGITYPMEMHMVHTLADDPEKYLVIGVLFREGEADENLSSILDVVPEQPGDTRDLPEFSIDATKLLEFSEHYYHYEGSLTTAPYSETVTWLVMKEIHQASPAQLQTLNILEGNNARHIQSLHARQIDSN